MTVLADLCVSSGDTTCDITLTLQSLAMPLCGPKLSMCCSVLSAWGMVQLGLTGLFFYLGSPALIEDIPLLEK